MALGSVRLYHILLVPLEVRGSCSLKRPSVRSQSSALNGPTYTLGPFITAKGRGEYFHAHAYGQVDWVEVGGNWDTTINSSIRNIRLRARSPEIGDGGTEEWKG